MMVTYASGKVALTLLMIKNGFDSMNLNMIDFTKLSKVSL